MIEKRQRKETVFRLLVFTNFSETEKCFSDDPVISVIKF